MGSGNWLRHNGSMGTMNAERLYYHAGYKKSSLADELPRKLKRFLMTNLNKPWNAVYSQICYSPHWAWARRNFGILKDELRRMVVMPGRLQEVNGELQMFGRDGPYRLTGSLRKFYVDGSGLLRLSPREKRHVRNHEPLYRQLGDGSLIAKEKGIWYRFVIQACPDLSVAVSATGAMFKKVGSCWHRCRYELSVTLPETWKVVTSKDPINPCCHLFEPKQGEIFCKDPFDGNLYKIMQKLQIGKANLRKLGLRPKPRRALPVA